MAAKINRARSGSKDQRKSVSVVKAVTCALGLALIGVLALPPLLAFGSTPTPAPSASAFPTPLETLEAQPQPTPSDEKKNVPGHGNPPSPAPQAPSLDQLPSATRAAIAEEKSALVRAAVAQRRYHEARNTFLESGPKLWDWGFEGRDIPKVVVQILRADADGYCLSAMHADLYPEHVYYLSDRNPAPTAEACR